MKTIEQRVQGYDNKQILGIYQRAESLAIDALQCDHTFGETLSEIKPPSIDPNKRFLAILRIYVRLSQELENRHLSAKAKNLERKLEDECFNNHSFSCEAEKQPLRHNVGVELHDKQCR